MGLTDIGREEVRVWLAATNGFSLGSGLGTHCNRKRRLNAAVLRARLLLSPHSSHLDSAPGVSGSLWFSFTRCRAMYAVRSRAVLRGAHNLSTIHFQQSRAGLH